MVMKLLIVCMITSVVVIGFVVSVMHQEPEDTKAEKQRQQLNDWQDRDILEND